MLRSFVRSAALAARSPSSTAVAISCSGVLGLRLFSMLHRDNINGQVVKAEYAVRGELVLRAADLSKKLQQPNHGLPFTEGNSVHSCISIPETL